MLALGRGQRLLSVRAALGASVRSRTVCSTADLRFQEPPLPTPEDADLDRTGAVSSEVDPFSSRKLQGKGGVFRGRDVVPMWIADMDFRSAPPGVDAVVACAARGLCRRRGVRISESPSACPSYASAECVSEPRCAQTATPTRRRSSLG